MATEELYSAVESAKKEYQKMQFDHTVSPLANPLEIVKLRRNIARYLTEIRQRELAEEGSEGREALRARRARVKKEKNRIARKAHQKRVSRNF